VVPLATRPEHEATVANGNGSQEPVQSSSTGTSDAQAAPQVRVLDPQYTPASEEPATPPEIRWGGPAGGW
jgi:hypothetical protein